MKDGKTEERIQSRPAGRGHCNACATILPPLRRSPVLDPSPQPALSPIFLRIPRSAVPIINPASGRLSPTPHTNRPLWSRIPETTRTPGICPRTPLGFRFRSPRRTARSPSKPLTRLPASRKPSPPRKFPRAALQIPAPRNKLLATRNPSSEHRFRNHAPLAQLDRASVYGTEGCRFESCGVYSTYDKWPSRMYPGTTARAFSLACPEVMFPHSPADCEESLPPAARLPEHGASASSPRRSVSSRGR